MSVKITQASLMPNPVNTSTQFLISVEVYDDAFEFSTTVLSYDEHQSFADLEQTVGGKLQ